MGFRLLRLTIYNGFGILAAWLVYTSVIEYFFRTQIELPGKPFGILAGVFFFSFVHVVATLIESKLESTHP